MQIRFYLWDIVKKIELKFSTKFNYEIWITNNIWLIYFLNIEIMAP